MKIKNPFRGFTKFEIVLWLSSCFFTIVLFLFNPQKDYLSLAASLLGVTSLIFVARGNVIGQGLILIFSILYAIISYRFSYFGEMITYLGMTAPIALFSAIEWLRNPYKKGENEVKTEKLTAKKIIILTAATVIVTAIFYYVLKYFNTPNLFFSTVSVATSFSASALMLLRSPYYAIAYGCNDIVLIILWILAAMENIGFLSMVLCFVIFLVNDIYGFISWKRMAERQSKGC